MKRSFVTVRMISAANKRTWPQSDFNDKGIYLLDQIRGRVNSRLSGVSNQVMLLRAQVFSLSPLSTLGTSIIWWCSSCCSMAACSDVSLFKDSRTERETFPLNIDLLPFPILTQLSAARMLILLGFDLNPSLPLGLVLASFLWVQREGGLDTWTKLKATKNKLGRMGAALSWLLLSERFEDGQLQHHLGPS